jgi:hypothetical protein
VRRMLITATAALLVAAGLASPAQADQTVVVRDIPNSQTGPYGIDFALA